MKQPEQIGNIYYLRNPEDQSKPYAVVAIAKQKVGEQWVFSRGISLCSTEDQFEKDKGRKIAYSRLNAAIERKMSFLPIKADHRERCKQLLDHGMKFKCQYDVQISSAEHRMLFKPDEK